MTASPRKMQHSMAAKATVPILSGAEGPREFTCFIHVPLPDSWNELVPNDLMEFGLKRAIELDRADLIDFHTNKIRGKLLEVWREQHPDFAIEGIVGRFVVHQHYLGDDRFWEDVKAGKFNGVSWGGDMVEIIDHCLNESCSNVVGLYTQAPEIYEISLVVNPSNPGATHVEPARVKTGETMKAECRCKKDEIVNGADALAKDDVEVEKPEQPISGATDASTPQPGEAPEMTADELAKVKADNDALRAEVARYKAECEARTKAEEESRLKTAQQSIAAFEARLKALEDARTKEEAPGENHQPDKNKAEDEKDEDKDDAGKQKAAATRIQRLEDELARVKSDLNARSKGNHASTPRSLTDTTAPGDRPSNDEAARVKTAAKNIDVKGARSMAQLQKEFHSL